MTNYQAVFTHRIAVRNLETGMTAEKECDAAWWVNTPNWAQLFILDGLRRELEAEELKPKEENDELVVEDS